VKLTTRLHQCSVKALGEYYINKEGRQVNKKGKERERMNEKSIKEGQKKLEKMDRK
jgi:hypothetical protein